MINKERPQIAIIGGGLAGCEVAWQLVKRGHSVAMYEMRPHKTTEAHRTEHLAELVCSNSLKSEDHAAAHGLLKAEMELADSLVVRCAKQTRVPAGSALAVDRDLFSDLIEKELASHPGFHLIREEAKDLTELKKEYQIVVVASGPLSSEALSESLLELLGDEHLYFYDSIAPVLFRESINEEIAFLDSRYQKGDRDYLNCPMNESEYEVFYQNLTESKKVEYAEFEKAKHFEGCLPVEVMAERGFLTLAYGPFKPVGFLDPRTGKQPFALLQLRQENHSGTLFNMVGCQTKMTYPEQKRVFRLIPGLEEAEFARYGSMHRNTYINAPKHLKANLELKKAKGVYLAGQITGVEGYAESAAMGIWCGLQLLTALDGKDPLIPDPTTCTGGLVDYLMKASAEGFQPMNANFGLLRPLSLGRKIGKKEKKLKLAELALDNWEKFLKSSGFGLRHREP